MTHPGSVSGPTFVRFVRTRLVPWLLPGPRTLDMREVASEYSKALHRPVRYLDVPFEQWREHELAGHQLPSRLADHLATMARLHAQDRYNRLTHDVEAVTGRPASSFSEAIARHAALFQ
jgi:NAD(P)H dehydrogenase (quinone)